MKLKSLNQVKNHFLSGAFMILGYTIAILIISFGTSTLMDTRQNILDKSCGLPEHSASLDIIGKLKLQNYNEIFKDISKSSAIEITRMNANIKNAGNENSANLTAVMFNEKPEWTIPICDGRYLSIDESLSDKKVAVIGNALKSLIKKENGKKIIIFNNENFEVIGIAGKTNRDSLWDDCIYVPMKSLPIEIKNNIDNQNRISITIKKNGQYPKDEYKRMDELVKKIDGSASINAANLKVDKDPMANFWGEVSNFTIFAILILAIAVINVVNLSMYWIYDRKKEIALRKVVGATDYKIFKLVLKEMISLAIIGAILALLIQEILSVYFKDWLQIPIDLSLANFIVALCVIIVCGLMTSLIPTKLTLKLQPNEVMKN